MTDGDRPLNNEWVLGPDEPIMDLWEAAFSWGRGMEPYRGTRERGIVSKRRSMGTVRKVLPTGNVRRTPRPTGDPRCGFCGALTKLIGRKLFCRDCGYFEGCCDGGKEAIREGELREGEC